jgi:hypothetical protein
VILSMDEIVIFNLSYIHLDSNTISLAEVNETTGDILCGMALVIDMKNAFYKHTGEFGEKKHLILTGH